MLECNMRHFHVVVGGRETKTIFAESEYTDARESIQAFLGLTRNMLHGIVDEASVNTEQALYHMADNHDGIMTYVTGGPWTIFWAICDDCGKLAVRN